MEYKKEPIFELSKTMTKLEFYALKNPCVACLFFRHNGFEYAFDTYWGLCTNPDIQKLREKYRVGPGPGPWYDSIFIAEEARSDENLCGKAGKKFGDRKSQKHYRFYT